jgi:hypothetical protein
MLATVLVALAPGARADEAPAQEPGRNTLPDEHRRFGIGWVAGNGLGFRGAEVIVAPWRRLAFELQVSQRDAKLEGASSTDETASGWGVAPLVRAYLRPHGTTPYAAAGASVTRFTYRSLEWTSKGVFATAGVELRQSSRLRLVVGAGVGYSPAVSVSDGSVGIRRDRYRGVNIELGLRWMF